MMKPITKKLIWLTLFSIAMGFMETVVVVYLRKIYYPNGFQFPLMPMDPDIAVAEFLREAATIIMLIGIGILAGKIALQKFAFFIYCFAVWDIFYYVFLKILLDWPESLFTWDILFIIPVPWVGPVLAPCLVSITMIILVICLIYFQEKGFTIKIKLSEGITLVAGSLLIILSFTWDYLNYTSHESAAKQPWTLYRKEFMFNEIINYVPIDYNWWLFLAGEAIIVFAIITFVKRARREQYLVET